MADQLPQIEYASAKETEESNGLNDLDRVDYDQRRKASALQHAAAKATMVSTAATQHAIHSTAKVADTGASAFTRAVKESAQHEYEKLKARRRSEISTIEKPIPQPRNIPVGSRIRIKQGRKFRTAYVQPPVQTYPIRRVAPQSPIKRLVNSSRYSQDPQQPHSPITGLVLGHGSNHIQSLLISKPQEGSHISRLVFGSANANTKRRMI